MVAKNCRGGGHGGLGMHVSWIEDDSNESSRQIKTGDITQTGQQNAAGIGGSVSQKAKTSQ